MGIVDEAIAPARLGAIVTGTNFTMRRRKGTRTDIVYLSDNPHIMPVDFHWWANAQMPPRASEHRFWE